MPDQRKHSPALPAVAVALAYEQALFDPSTGTWRELRDPASPAFWCYGSTGIGLGRVGVQAHLAGNHLVEAEIAAALAMTRRYGFGNMRLLRAARPDRAPSVLVSE